MDAVLKWRITFSGDGAGLSLNDFLLQSEDLRKPAGLSEADLRDAVIHLLRGPALTWYRAFNERFSTWGELKQALRKNFLPYDYDHYLRCDIDRRFQGENEQFSVFLASMEMLFKNLSRPPPEEEKIEILRRNMRPELADRLAVYDIVSVEQIFNVMKHLERTNYVKQRRANPAAEPLEPAFFTPATSAQGRQRASRKVYELVESSEESDETEVAVIDRARRKQGNGRKLDTQGGPTEGQTEHQLNRVGTNSTPATSTERPAIRSTGLVCWNCEEEGHNYRQCQKPKERYFCFYCGKKDTTSLRCPRCRLSGNEGGTGR
jgi:Retrotransposon gag protein